MTITFEVLDRCCSNVIIGEEILWKYDVYERHSCSIIKLTAPNDPLTLAPFNFVTGWQKKIDAMFASKALKRQSGKPLRLSLTSDD